MNVCRTLAWENASCSCTMVGTLLLAAPGVEEDFLVEIITCASSTG